MSVAKFALEVAEALMPPLCLAFSVLAASLDKVDFAIYFVVIGIFIIVNRHKE